MKGKVTVASILTVLCFFLTSISVSANEIEVDNSVGIPYHMEPGTIIVYDDDLNPVIVKGGYAAQSRASAQSFSGPVLVDVPENATAEEKAQIELENSIAMSAYRNYLSGNYVQAPTPKIYPGMKVVYDETSGAINNIYYVDEKDPSGYSIHNEPSGTAEVQEYMTARATQWTWGSNFVNTVIYQASDDSFQGTGRATYFTGTIGNRNNTLKDRDCATQKTYDYSRVGDKDVIIRNVEQNFAITFYQADVGTLPDAVIDIWGLNNIHDLAGNTKDTAVNSVRYYHKRFSDQSIPK